MTENHSVLVLCVGTVVSLFSSIIFIIIFNVRMNCQVCGCVCFLLIYGRLSHAVNCCGACSWPSPSEQYSITCWIFSFFPCRGVSSCCHLPSPCITVGDAMAGSLQYSFFWLLGILVHSHHAYQAFLFVLRNTCPPSLHTRTLRLSPSLTLPLCFCPHWSLSLNYSLLSVYSCLFPSSLSLFFPSSHRISP